MENPGVSSSPLVRIFMQITSDPMRRGELLFDLKDFKTTDICNVELLVTDKYILLVALEVKLLFI